MVKYDARLADNPRDAEAIAGKLKCLDALGRWEEAIELCQQSLGGPLDPIPGGAGQNSPMGLSGPPTLVKVRSGNLSSGGNSLQPRSASVAARQVATLRKLQNKAAVTGARAAWSLNQWDLMDSFVTQLPSDNLDACFMKAVLAIHREVNVSFIIVVACI